MALEEDFELGEILLILVVIVVIGYFIYKGFASLGDFFKNFHLPKLSDLFNFNSGGGSAGTPSAGNNTGTSDANIKVEIDRGACGVMTPATAAGSNSSCGGAQANCCTGNCTCQ